MATARASERVGCPWDAIPWESGDHDRVAAGVRRVLAGGADPNETFMDGFRHDARIRTHPVSKAARHGHDEAMRALVAAGADIDDDTDFSMDAMRSAILGGHPRTAMVALDLGASPDLRRPNTASALWHAFRHATDDADGEARIRPGAVDLMRRLVAAGADPTTVGPEGTILHAAVHGGRPDVTVPLAVAMGCPTESRRMDQHVPLWEAVQDRHRGAVAALIVAKADLDVLDGVGGNLLDAAMESAIQGDGTIGVGGIDIAAMLLAAGMSCRPPRMDRHGRVAVAAVERALMESGDRGAVVAWCMRSRRLTRPGPLPPCAADQSIRAWAATGAAANIGEPWAMRLFAALGTAP